MTKIGAEIQARYQTPFPWVRFLWFCSWILLTLTLVWPSLRSDIDNTPAPRLPNAWGYNYLVIAPQKLYQSAQAWVAYRQSSGYRATAYMIDNRTTSEQIRWVIHEIYHRSGDPYPFYVLLLGHAHLASSYPVSYLPTDKLRLSKGERLTWGYEIVPGDSGYAYDPRSHKWLPIAIGRIPAIDYSYAMDVLTRTQKYETQPPVGEGRNRIEIIASSTDWGAWIDQVFERLLNFYVNTHLPDSLETHVLTGNPDSSYSYPLEDLVNETARRFDSGALLVSYIGHGGDDILTPAYSRDGYYTWIFSFEDLHRIQRASDSVMTFVACDVGQFDLPGDRFSLAEAFLLFNRGPVATFAASRITFPLPNAILEMDLLQTMSQERFPTVGQWLQRVRDAPDNPIDPSLLTWLGRKIVPYLYVLTTGEFSIGKINPQSCYPWQRYAYNLFGDPALALAYPSFELEVEPRFRWLPFGHKLSFSGKGPLSDGQTVYVSLSYPAGATPDYSGNIKDQRFIYARNNSKTLSATSVHAAINGKFEGEVRLPSGLQAGRYILQVIAMTDKETLIGSESIYIGVSPFAFLGSAPLWWLLISIILWSRLVHKHLIKPRLSVRSENPGQPPRNIAQSRYLKPIPGCHVERLKLDQISRRKFSAASTPSLKPLKAVRRRRNPKNDRFFI